jgi:hypothetical protein
MTRAAARILVLISLFWLIACGRAAAPIGPSTKTPDKVVMTGQADGAPAGCGVPEVGQRLLDFASAFNDRKPETAETFFDSRAPFAWYSAPEGAPKETIAVYSADDLPKYFEQRYAQNETLQFKRINVNGWEAERGVVHFDFTVNRQADDLNRGISVDVVGKGALHCATKSFVVISIGDAPG